MQFLSPVAMLTFPLAVIVYYLLPAPARKYWLCAVSAAYYAWLGLTHALLLLVITAAAFLFAFAIARAKDRQKKTVLFAAVALDTALLLFFKYTFRLPPGMSFYMLHVIGYLIDIYRGVPENTVEDLRHPAPANIIRQFVLLLTFVSFFPNVISGPIERSHRMFPQFEKPAAFDYNRMVDGLLLMLWGYFLKLVLSARMAIPIGTVYDNPQAYRGVVSLLIMLLYSMQLYCDFAGYSCIAIGAAQVLGITIRENFRAPYLAPTIADFWNRWHISFSSWLRDYLYFPLGGSKRGTARTCLNLLIVFAVSGIWHGAAFTFVVWGILHGIYQIAARLLREPWKRCTEKLHINRSRFSHRFFFVLFTFLLASLAWFFFRAPDTVTALDMLRHVSLDLGPVFDGTLYTLGIDKANVHVIPAGIALVVAVDLCNEKGIRIREHLMNQSLWMRWPVLLFAIVVIFVFGIWGAGYDASNFIYAQF
ncbi:MAG: MBOAT family protein [Lachnospiraceae bacterium]|nr:MBOAT family protein [Lachnospiraceae bacterium]